MTNFIVLGLVLSYIEFSNAMHKGLNGTNKQFPYIVSIHLHDKIWNGFRWIYMKFPPGRFPTPYCSGSILNETVVLTAAHCCEAYQQHYRKVLAGTADWTKRENAQWAKIVDFELHPNWIGTDKLYANPDRVSVAYDACILKLETPGLKLNDKVKAINLGGKVPKRGTKCTIAGWGDTVPTLGPQKNSNHLQYLNVKTQSKKGCQYPPSWEARKSLDRTVNVIFEENVQVCAGSKVRPWFNILNE